MKEAILIDIDNTIVDSYCVFDKVIDKSQTEQFKYFYKHVKDCKPINWMIDFVQLINMPIVFLTGRSEECKKETEEHLLELGFENFELVMRKRNDFSPDEDMKRVWLQELVKEYDFRLAIDDRERNCDLYYKEFSIPTLMVYYPKELRY